MRVITCITTKVVRIVNKMDLRFVRANDLLHIRQKKAGNLVYRTFYDPIPSPPPV